MLPYTCNIYIYAYVLLLYLLHHPSYPHPGLNIMLMLRVVAPNPTLAAQATTLQAINNAWGSQYTTWTGNNPCTQTSPGIYQWLGISCDSTMQLVTSVSVSLQYQSAAIYLPPQISVLTPLTTLSCAECGISGRLISQLGYLTNLQYLDLTYNSLTSSITTFISHLTALVSIDVTSNQITGTLPTCLNVLTKMTSFIVGSNQLSGAFPCFLTSLKLLQTMGLTGCAIAGTIPACLASMTNLVSVS